MQRGGDQDDGRITRVRLTPDGQRRLDQLTPAHLDELRQLAPVLDALVTRWGGGVAEDLERPARDLRR